MKHSIAVILILLAAIYNVHSQSTDTTKVVLSHLPVLSKDSVRSMPKTFEIEPVIPDLREFNDLGKYTSTDNTVTFSLGKTSRRKTIFSSSYSKFIIPSALISYGLLTQGSERLKELDHSTHHEITEHYMERIHLDDYTQFASAAAVYGLDFLGIKARHNFRDRTIIMATSHIIMFTTVQGMKQTINVERPDGSNMNSFPSGHTATAFVGAHILFKEYVDVSPWIGVAGYAVATSTGIMRVTNKKHWVSDVVTGAGIGILSVELGYLILPVFHNMFGIKNRNSNFVIAPTIGKDNYGFGLAYTF